MGWKSTRILTRETIEKKIMKELNDINKLDNNTLCQILEIIGGDKNSDVYAGYNYMVGDEDEI